MYTNKIPTELNLPGGLHRRKVEITSQRVGGPVPPGVGSVPNLLRVHVL